MTDERRLKIARKIVADGIQAELARAETGPLLDMAPEDRESIKTMVQQICNGTAYVQFSCVDPDAANLWVALS